MARLGDVCDILNGFAFKSEQYVDDGIRIIRIANVQKGYIEDSTPVFYPFDSREAKKYSLEEGDILMSLTGNVGRVAKLSKEFLPAALNQRVACLRIKDGVTLDKAFLFNLLNSDYFEQQCIAASKGVAQKNMSTEWLKEYEIPMFPMEQQKVIASVLDKVTELISLRKEQLAKLDQLVKSRFIEMFGDPVTNERGWHVKPLLEIGSCKNGMNFHYEDNGVEINCLGVGDFKDHTTINDTSLLPTVSLNEMPSDEYLLKDDDIVFVRSNGNKALVGRSVAVYPGLVPTTFSGFCIRFRKTDDTIVIPYLLRVLKAESIRQKMAGRGANIQNLNQQILGTLVFPVPPIKLQNQFAEFIKQVDKSKLAIQQSLNKLELLKKSLMQKYFG